MFEMFKTLNVNNYDPSKLNRNPFLKYSDVGLARLRKAVIRFAKKVRKLNLKLPEVTIFIFIFNLKTSIYIYKYS